MTASTTFSTPRNRWRRRALVGAMTAGLAATSLAIAGPAQAAVSPASFAATSANPDLAKACGLDVVVVMDASYGVAHEGPNADQNYAPQVRDAALALVSSFQDTNTRVGIVKFNSTAYKSLPMTFDDKNQNNPLYFNGSGVGSLAYTISQYPGQIGGNTNWEDAWLKVNAQFASARPGVPRLVVFISDGAPNWNNAMQATSPAPALDPYGTAVVDPAIAQANAFKASGGHVLSVGIGPDFTPVNGALVNDPANDIHGRDKLTALETISETTSPEVVTPTALTDPVTTTTFHAATTDVLLQPDPNTLASSLRALATQQCAGSVSVTNQTTNSASPLAFVNGGAGWPTSATLPTAATWLKPNAGTGSAQSTSSQADGTSVYQWDQVSGTVTPTFQATMKAGYVFGGVSCTKDGQSGNFAVLGNQQVAPRTWSIVGGVQTGDVVSCTVSSYYRYATALTLTPVVKNVTFGRTKVYVGGLLRNSMLRVVPGKTVLFYGRKLGTARWVLIKKVVTSSTGRFAVPVAPLSSWQYFAAFGGSKTPLYTRSASKITQINVAYRVSAAATRTGNRMTIAGAVAPGARGKYVFLQRVIGGKWVSVAHTTLSAKSTYSFRVAIGAVHYYYRIFKPASSARYPAWIAGASKRFLV